MKFEKIAYEEFENIFMSLSQDKPFESNSSYSEIEDLSLELHKFYLYFDGKKFNVFFDKTYTDGMKFPKAIEISDEFIIIDGVEMQVSSLSFAENVKVDIDYLISIYYLLYSRLFSNKSILNSLLELSDFFEFRSQNFNEFIGLLGELLFIYSADEKKELIKMWHSGVSDKFDFSGGHYVEVKTTLGTRRLHHLSSDQIDYNLNPDIVSVKVQHVEEGASIHDLVAIITTYLDDETLLIFASKLKLYKCLNDYTFSKFKINLDDSIRSIKFFKLPLISILNDYPYVTSFQVKINFEQI